MTKAIVPHLYSRITGIEKTPNRGCWFKLADESSFTLPLSAESDANKIKKGDFALIHLEHWERRKVPVLVFRAREDLLGLDQVVKFTIGREVSFGKQAWNQLGDEFYRIMREEEPDRF